MDDITQMVNFFLYFHTAIEKMTQKYHNYATFLFRALLKFLQISDAYTG